MRTDELEPWREALRRMARDLGVPENLIAELFDEPNDWSFIIKAHALIEAALTEVLTVAIGREQLRGVVSRMSTGDKRQGKLAFAKSLGLLGKTVLRFVETLGRIRNQFVHDVHSVTLRIEDVVSRMSDPPQVWSAVGRAAARDIDSVEAGGQTMSVGEWARRVPKIAIYGGVLYSVTKMHAAKVTATDRPSRRTLQSDPPSGETGR
jgi:hypothetical protein